LDGDQALLFLQEIRDRLAIVTRSAEEHFRAMKEAAAVGIVAGTVCDVLLAHCAAKAEAQTLYTWNVKHFERLRLSAVKRIQTP
jgi:predicted nucleic acid-binding protein